MKSLELRCAVACSVRALTMKRREPDPVIQIRGNLPTQWSELNTGQDGVGACIMGDFRVSFAGDLSCSPATCCNL
jgi:hypothetical protein